jgi:hypothetical protein
LISPKKKNVSSTRDLACFSLRFGFIYENPVKKCAVKAGSASAPPNQSSSCCKLIYAKKTITQKQQLLCPKGCFRCASAVCHGPCSSPAFRHSGPCCSRVVAVASSRVARKCFAVAATATPRLRGLLHCSPPLPGTDRTAIIFYALRFCCSAVRRAWRRVRPLRGPAALYL